MVEICRKPVGKTKLDELWRVESEKLSGRSSIGIISLGFIRFCRLGGVAYRDGGFKYSPRTAADFGSQLSAMLVAYRDDATCWAIAVRTVVPRVTLN
ncbi:hypothetical protein E3N88_15132 [Mikania micrantha]|uniref:Uncharacterized protein n=1 Tax=Mikania micrantha TaxID=192012 RepID=A0A5N6NV70_9ASTR|nr:hypothetical protein E3N88_15132 [Mikania micrantha]